MTGFSNPILPGFNPDPTIVCRGDNYFLATSTFEYFPGVPIYTSIDLVDWQLIGHALNRRSQLDMRTAEAAAGIYAPTLRYNERRERWYMTTACVFKNAKKADHDSPPPPRGFYVWTDNIWDETKWSDPVYYDVAGIDQDLFFDDDGKVWLSWATTIPDHIDQPGHFSLTVWTVQIDLDTGDNIGQPKLIRQNTTFGNRVAEGPHIFKKDGVYYLITAEGGTEIEHSEWICRSTDGPRGPWEVGPQSTVNPMVYNGLDYDVMQTGHMDMVEGKDGQWWAVCLAVRPQRGILSHLGRETFLAPVEWKDGWPVVNAGRKIGLTGPEDSGLRRIRNQQSWKTKFNKDLDLYKNGWYHCRTPIKPYHGLSSAGLILKCGQYALQHDEAVSMLLKKQTAFVGTWHIEFEFEPTWPGEEAGVTVWWSKWAHCSVSIRGKRGTACWPEGQYGAELVFRKPKEEGNDFEVGRLLHCGY
ncbi:glycosyl hydrolase [Naematelia encephala]|uniref:Glycosyl hydrolase n=1 Tax=Naematelia encephala TaxID=71784 RepID=A0A1Y2BMD6_9TREE|nr:glycosyl hydrolase [Naematelia encephala]